MRDAKLNNKEFFNTLATVDGNTLWRAIPRPPAFVGDFIEQHFNESERVDILLKASIFHLYKPFVSAHVLIIFVDNVLNGSSDLGDYDDKLSDARRHVTKKPMEIRICPHCLVKHQKEYGTVYFKREWYVYNSCLVHNCRLLKLTEVARILNEKSLFNTLHNLFKGKNIIELLGSTKPSYIKQSQYIKHTSQYYCLLDSMPNYTPCIQEEIRNYFLGAFSQKILEKQLVLDELDFSNYNSLVEVKEDGIEHERVQVRYLSKTYIDMLLRLIVAYDEAEFFEYLGEFSTSFRYKVRQGLEVLFVTHQLRESDNPNEWVCSLCMECDFFDNQAECRVDEVIDDPYIFSESRLPLFSYKKLYAR
jgi:hypothetical protein